MNTFYKHFQCKVQLVWEKRKRETYVINQPSHVYTLVKDELIKKDREIFLSILLTTRNTVIGIETISIGTMNCCLISPRELFKNKLIAKLSAQLLSFTATLL